MLNGERRLDGKKSVEAHKRSNDQHQHRQHDPEDTAEQANAGCEVTPLTDHHGAQRNAAGTDGGELSFLREALIEERENEQNGEKKTAESHRRREARRFPGDHLEDSRGINVDAGGRAQELLDFENLEATNKSRHRYRKNRRGENRQSNAPQYSPKSRAANPCRFFDRCVKLP